MAKNKSSNSSKISLVPCMCLILALLVCSLPFTTASATPSTDAPSVAIELKGSEPLVNADTIDIGDDIPKNVTKTIRKLNKDENIIPAIPDDELEDVEITSDQLCFTLYDYSDGTKYEGADSSFKLAVTCVLTFNDKEYYLKQSPLEVQLTAGCTSFDKSGYLLGGWVYADISDSESRLTVVKDGLRKDKDLYILAKRNPERIILNVPKGTELLYQTTTSTAPNNGTTGSTSSTVQPEKPSKPTVDWNSTESIQAALDTMDSTEYSTEDQKKLDNIKLLLDNAKSEAESQIKEQTGRAEKAESKLKQLDSILTELKDNHIVAEGDDGAITITPPNSPVILYVIVFIFGAILGGLLVLYFWTQDQKAGRAKKRNDPDMNTSSDNTQTADQPVISKANGQDGVPPVTSETKVPDPANPKEIEIKILTKEAAAKWQDKNSKLDNPPPPPPPPPYTPPYNPPPAFYPSNSSNAPRHYFDPNTSDVTPIYINLTFEATSALSGGRAVVDLPSGGDPGQAYYRVYGDKLLPTDHLCAEGDTLDEDTIAYIKNAYIVSFFKFTLNGSPISRLDEAVGTRIAKIYYAKVSKLSNGNYSFLENDIGLIELER